MKVRHIPVNNIPFCPVCKNSLSCTTGPGLPSDGDLSICVYCKAILEFRENPIRLEVFRNMDSMSAEDKGIIRLMLEILEDRIKSKGKSS